MQSIQQADAIRQAIQTLFHTRNQSSDQDIRQADEFLKQFSKSHQAWSITINMLMNDNETDTVLTFQLVRILKGKLQYDFVTLNQQEISAVYNSCVQIVKKYATSNDRAVRLTVALILIYIYVQTFENWSQDILQYLMQELNFGIINQIQGVQKFCFDVLDSWPEELIENDKLVIDVKRKTQLIEQVKQNSMSNVFQQLQLLWNNNISQNDNSLKYLILRCYSRWVQFVRYVLTSTERIQFLMICKTCPVFLGALTSLTNEELQEKAQDLIRLVVSLIPKDQAQKILVTQQDINELVQVIITQTFETFPQARQALKDELPDEINAFIKLYTKIGKKFIHQIITLPQLTQSFLENYLVLFQDSQTDEQAEEMCTFWIKFFLTIQKYPQLKTTFDNFLDVLLTACIQKCRVSVEYLTYYSDPSSQETKDDKSDNSDDDNEIDDIKGQFEVKREVRLQIREVMETWTQFEDAKIILLKVASMIKQQNVAMIFENPGPFKMASEQIQEGWAVFEACLYIINSVLPTIVASSDQVGNHYVMEVMELYLGLQQTNYFIVKTTLKTIGEGGAELLQSHSSMIPRVFEYVYQHLKGPRKSLRKLASKTFIKICQFNPSFVIGNFAVFNTMLKQMSNLEELDNLINGIAEAVCSNNTTLLQHFESLCSVFAQNLVELKNQIAQNIQDQLFDGSIEKLKQFKKQNKSIIKQIRRNLDALTMTIRKVPNDEEEANPSIQQLVVQVYIQLWPLLSYFVDTLAKIDDNIAEKVVRITKHTWRCTYNAFSVQLLTEVLRKFIEGYTQQPISSYIYAIEVITTVFYKYEDYRQILQEAFEKICELTFSHLPKIQNFEEKPDLTEDFFGLLLRYAKYTPTLILQSQSLDYILKLTEIGIGIEHGSAAKSIYSWMEVLFKFLGKNRDPCFKSQVQQIYLEKLSGLLVPMIPNLFQRLFGVIFQGISDEEVAEYLFDVIKAISNIDIVQYDILLKTILDQREFQLLTSNEKTEWVEGLKSRTFDDNQSLFQTQFLDLLNRRANLHASRS